ncbi:hypothetical protein T07_9560 [Trichinella nelsoni]|uniref:Uncharacterized protein n=1 Tax=Trichinella nelsoni TaxID=6336 RepID=A0A0V0S372_9BILA|nr:hypothetical protein T07_9560 [Trichinella nelsoni]
MNKSSFFKAVMFFIHICEKNAADMNFFLTGVFSRGSSTQGGIAFSDSLTQNGMNCNTLAFYWTLLSQTYWKEEKDVLTNSCEPLLYDMEC